MKGIKTAVSTAYPSGTVSADVTPMLKEAFPSLNFDVMDRRRLYYDFGFTISLRDESSKDTLAWYRPGLEKLWDLMGFLKVPPDNLAGLYDLCGFHGFTKKELFDRGILYVH